ncbi:Uma2 family endonuclease [Streptomyces sp. NPDC018610]|uniref:Uma2 family endonuclease n=1 Tax=Streptomyces sp. NPDC018610 TaxID=3365049 RepID=UPI00379E4D8C
MTVMAERTSHASQMSVEEFERIAAYAAKETDDAVRFEFIDGRIGAKRVPDGDYNTIDMWLMRQCMQARPDLDLYQGQGLKVEKYRKGRARPDGVLVPAAHFAGHGEWAPAEGVLLVLEVTSYDSDTDRRDRQEKPVAYGAAGIPCYLLVDRDDCSVTLFSEPGAERGYGSTVRKSFGGVLSLPEPLGIELDTTELKQYAD